MKIGMGKLRKKWIVGLVLGCIALGLVVSGVAIWIKCSAMPDDIQVEQKLTAADSIFFDSVKKAKQTSNKIIDSTFHIKVDLYRVLNYKGDTTIWRTSDCKIMKKSFECYHQECWGIGCSGFRTRIGDRIAKIHYKDTVYDTTYRNLNFGKNALVHYTPIAKVPKFNRKAVAKALSKLSGKPCYQIFELRSNYKLEAIGLPGFSWKNRNDYDWGLEAYVKSDEKTNESKCEVREPLVLYHPDANAYRNVSWSLPEKIQNYTYLLFNESMDCYRDTTITWKLVYKDQYGRGDTLDITTKFKVDDSDDEYTWLRQKKRCYDTLDSERCK
jgi:hypothetical protein